ncbi:hypothetical protein F5879DRAFT_455844 [Lentinula edodes]|uniref:Ccch zinc finger and rrm domain-containing protein n=1 Tax=Lentinula edodes TaxID=5353 RepID=A0A1Q3EQ59_LENED|nr:hypothetical protein F5879DRAFT_455844 [Lentinula edodes]GAW09315.1 ccch zinc finger and rrm domain-containing protein [Lentinula edodes]
MIFEESNAPHLKPWLIRTLEPICDAEPGALADYILALLKHNVPEPEMKNDLKSQLDEFLEKECTPFIDTLFTALRTKSYLPYTDEPPAAPKSLDTGIPIPLDALLSSPTSPEGSRKRSLENPDPGGRPSSKGPRIEGLHSRYPNGRGGGGSDARSASAYSNRGRGNGIGPINAYQPPDQKRICRDYYNLGFCSRGALCKFSHGEDALVPDQLYINGGMPFMPMLGNGLGMGSGPAAAYDPREAQMDMRLMGSSRNNQARPAVLPRMQQEEGASRVVHKSTISGELPVIQDLTPEVPHNAVTPNPATHSTHSPANSSTSPIQNPPLQSLPNHPEPSYMPNVLPTLRNFPQDVDMEMSLAGHIPIGNWRGGRGGGRANGRGRQPGAFNGDHATFQPERRKDKTLVLEKIPEDKLSLTQVNDWFKRFGTVTNVAIDQGQQKALISFSTHEEAHAAWKSEDAVFNNRFVKVFWHRPMEGHGDAGRRALAASAPVLAKTSANKITSPTPTTAPPRKSSVTSTAAALAEKQQLLDKQIAEQKSLMTSLISASSIEEKKKIMDRFKQLDEEMKASSAIPLPSKDDKQIKERERLDKELELHSTDVQVNAKADGETTEHLKAKLERLKAEAASLGISDDPHSTHPGPSYRGYRGRGRGTRGSYFRGGPRGGPPRTNMTLDNRPKRLLVKGVSSENEQALRDWYETTGQMESITQTETGDMVVSFRTRTAAEQGLAKGTSIPMVGSVKVAWLTGQPTSSPIGSVSTDSRAVETSLQEASKVDLEELEPDSLVEEAEDVVVSGWGREDDGMGM